MVLGLRSSERMREEEEKIQKKHQQEEKEKMMVTMTKKIFMARPWNKGIRTLDDTLSHGLIRYLTPKST